MHLPQNVFRSRRGPLHPELLIWLGSVDAQSDDELAEEKTKTKKKKKKKKKKRKRKRKRRRRGDEEKRRRRGEEKRRACPLPFKWGNEETYVFNLGVLQVRETPACWHM